MALCSDLEALIRGQFAKHGISYDRSMTLPCLAARYFEMNVRRIQPARRRVHFSDQIHASLGELSRQPGADRSAHDAWATVFRLRHLFVEGTNVNAFLSTGIRSATGWDGLLWNYGMHHLHLSSGMNKGGFVKRSPYLLFAIIATLDAYFVRRQARTRSDVGVRVGESGPPSNRPFELAAADRGERPSRRPW